MRTFVRMREMLTSNRERGDKLSELERRFATHDGVAWISYVSFLLLPQLVFQTLRTLL